MNRKEHGPWAAGVRLGLDAATAAAVERETSAVIEAAGATPG